MLRDTSIFLSKLDMFIIAFYSILPFVGHISIFNIRVLGFILTPYRVCIPLLFLYFFYKRIQEGLKSLIGEDSVYNNQYFIHFLLLFAFFIIYGFVSLAVSPYTDFRTGFLELVNIGLGFLSIIIIYEISSKKGGLLFFIKSLRIILIILLIFGLFEITTGSHFFVSRYSDLEFLKKVNLSNKIINISTGLYYNENDFSALIALFSPLLFLGKDNNRIENVVNIVALISVIVILTLNNSWICLLSLLIGMIFYLLIMKESFKIWILNIFSMLFSHYAISKGFALLINRINIVKMKKFSDKPNVKIKKKSIASFQEELRKQINFSGNKKGSLFLRLNTYITSTLEMFNKTYGLGFGPGSFQLAIKEMQNERLLLNPHSLWIEILVQYGVFVFLFFIVFLLGIFIKLFKTILENENRLLGLILAMDIMFVLVAFSSSNWLKSAIIWLPIGITLALTNFRDTKFST